MLNMNQSQSIKLGFVLEACMVPMLEMAGYSFDNSESYSELLTRPDFIVFENGQPIFSLAVTATSSRDTWIKKRWRYVDEVAQLKSYYGEDFLTINVLYSNPAVFGKSELNFINAFFDKSIITEDLELGKEYFEYVEQYVIDNDKLSVESLTSHVLSTKLWEKQAKILLAELKRIVLEKRELTRANLYRNIWKKEHPGYIARMQEVKERTYSCKETYLRYSVLNGLLIGVDNMRILIDSVKNNKPVPIEVVEKCKITEFKFVKKIGGYFVDDEKLLLTVKEGFSAEVYAKVEKTIFTNESQIYLLKDIQDKDRLQFMVDNVIPVIGERDELETLLVETFSKDNYRGFLHTRVWPIDVIVTYLNISIIQLNKMYVARYNPSVTSAVVNYVSKIDIAKSMLATNNEVKKFSHELTDVIIEEVKNGLGTENEMVSRLLSYKIHSLFLQPYINPVQRYVEMILEDNGCSYSKDSLTCMLGAINNIPAGMKKIKEVYQVKKGTREVWIKCIAGYDGVKDKTREMAARGHLLKYESPNGEKRNIKMVFVYDGKWNIELQQLLALSGWNEIVPIFHLDEYIKKFFS